VPTKSFFFLGADIVSRGTDPSPVNHEPHGRTPATSAKRARKKKKPRDTMSAKEVRAAQKGARGQRDHRMTND
jgi:hypothetical protein